MRELEFPHEETLSLPRSVKPVDKFFVCIELNVLPYPYGMQGIEDNLLLGRRHGYDTPTTVEITSTPEVYQGLETRSPEL